MLMKKMLILASVLTITMTSVYAGEVAQTTQPQKLQAPVSAKMCKPNNKFEQRLNLTEAQKAQAQELRKKSHEQMKPIMKAIGEKHKALKDLYKENLIESEKQIKAEKLKSELSDLDKQARELRKQNMKDFEAILTNAQKKELAKIKKEGRKNFAKTHPRHDRPNFASPEFRKPCPDRVRPQQAK